MFVNFCAAPHHAEEEIWSLAHAAAWNAVLKPHSVARTHEVVDATMLRLNSDTALFFLALRHSQHWLLPTVPLPATILPAILIQMKWAVFDG